MQSFVEEAVFDVIVYVDEIINAIVLIVIGVYINIIILFFYKLTFANQTALGEIIF